jgi:hypothetical protein
MGTRKFPALRTAFCNKKKQILMLAYKMENNVADKFESA